MKQRKLGLTTQALILLVVLVLGVNLLLGLLLSGSSRDALKTQMRERMLDVSDTAAAMLDPVEFDSIRAQEPDSPAWKNVLRTLNYFEENDRLDSIYTLRADGAGSWYYVVDASHDAPAVYGEASHVSAALETACATGESAVDEEPYEDRWGRFYSAYSPIRAADGSVAGLVAVDMSAEWYDEQLAYSGFLTFVTIGISLVVCLWLVFHYGGRYKRGLDELNAELNEVGDEVDALMDEIGLAHGETAELTPEPEEPDELGALGALGGRLRSIRDGLRNYVTHTHTQANSMITAMASDYRSVYYVDLDKDQGVCFRSHDSLTDGLREGEGFPFLETFTAYGNEHVTESYREGFLHYIQPDTIRAALANEQIIAYRYLSVHEGHETYEMLRMAGVRHPEDRADHIVHAVGIGFSDVDGEMREEIEQRKALSDALAAANEANKAKTVFLSNMSHEIRTPMNAIIGLDNIALHEPGISDTTREHLVKIGDAARHLLTIINDILDVSRIESGRMTIRSERFSLRALLEQVNTIIGGQCEDKGVHYRCMVGQEVEESYLGDDTKLRQVLINILGNAVKFTPRDGSVELRIARTARYEGKSTLRCVMRDTGIGMSKEYLPKIFDAFSQEAGASANNKLGSTGLGMAITRNIVDLMNGSIRVESEKGVGTTFTVTVTLQDCEDTERGTDPEAVFDPTDMSVLVVDDDPVACEHASLTLSQLGMKVETAASGAEALEMVKLRGARQEPYELILMDWKMPELDGVETTRRIREMAGAEPAIIILTAYRWDEIQETALEAGVDSFLSKPLFVSNVLEELKRTVTARAAARESAPEAELEGRRMLIAEDIDVNAEILEMLLESEGMESERGENGRVALELFKSNPPGYFDAVLMDMRMLVMDGLEATRAIRALDRPDAKRIPIIALTANAFDEDVQNSLQAGLNAHLSKPVDPEVLFQTLRTLIGKAERAQ